MQVHHAHLLAHHLLRFSILIGSGGDASRLLVSLQRGVSNVSVSSSDRVVMQVSSGSYKELTMICFSILIGSGGDASFHHQLRLLTKSCFSILIGSGGDASLNEW